MSKNVTSLGAGGVGFPGLLTIAFIILKLCKVIDWSWWWVLSPLWISFGLFLLIVMFILGLAIIIAIYDDKKRRIR